MSVGRRRRRGRRPVAADPHLSLGGARPDLGARHVPAEEPVDHVRHVVVHRQPVLLLNLDDDLKCGRRLAFQHRLLGSPPAGLLVAQRHRLYPPDEIAQGGVLEEVVEGVAVRGGDELYAPLRDRAGRQRLRFGADLVDDDDLRHVVFHGLDHHRVLELRDGDLHAARAPDPRVGDIAVAGDFVARVHHDHPFGDLVGEDAGGLPEEGGLADPRPPNQQDALPRLDDIPHDVDRAEHRPADAAGQPDDLADPVADRRDPVQRSLDPGAVVFPERADPADHVLHVVGTDEPLRQPDGPAGKPGFGLAPEVEHDLQELLEVRLALDGVANLRRQDAQEHVQVIGNPDLLTEHPPSPRLRPLQRRMARVGKQHGGEPGIRLSPAPSHTMCWGWNISTSIIDAD